MEHTERMRYVSAIDALHAARHEVSALQATAQTKLATLPTHDPGMRAPALRYAMVQLSDAWHATDEAILCTEAALMRIVPLAKH